MTLTEYIKRRNAVPIGSSKSLRNNLYRSLGAKKFSAFWNYWNPIFGYYLGKFIFKPLKRIFPIDIAFVFTFIFCGLIHDGITTIFRGKTSLFFTIWFSIMGLAVLITKYLNHNFKKRVWVFRALANLGIICLCLLITIYLKKLLIAS